MSKFLVTLFLIFSTSLNYKLISGTRNNDNSDSFEPIDIQYLSLENIAVLPNPKTTPSFAKLKGISIANSTISNFQVNYFKQFPHLVEITLVNNKLRHHILNMQDFNVLTKLEKLHVKNQNVKPITANCFDKMTKLKDLAIVSADLSTIDENAFVGLEHLENLDLSGNSLGIISRKTLQPLKNLKIMILDDELIYGPGQISDLENFHGESEMNGFDKVREWLYKK